jgi:hypothetical protein
MKTYDDVPTVLTFNGVPVKARRGFWPMVVLVWVLLAVIGVWRWPGQSALAYVLVGGVGLLLGMLVDVGHACAHTIGAKMVHAPTALILLGADMPRTLYPDEPKRPGQHIARSMGGPIYSWIGIGIGLLALNLTAPQSAARYLAEIWTFGNTMIGVAIFLPLPIVDGGVILKWLLVIGGQDEEQADRIVRWVDMALIVLLLVGAGVAALMGWWVAAAGLVILAIVIGLVVAGIIQ